jgi:uncharacterized protein (DUF1810 family)
MDGLERFIQAQGTYPLINEKNSRFDLFFPNDYASALEEVKRGKKVGHWIWYIFPQLKGLGHSYNSNFYGISDFEEAQAYLNHPILGSRLREITNVLLNQTEDFSAQDIFGGIDSMKVKSCMTLFYMASKEQLFLDVLNRYYKGSFDKRTLEKLGLEI